MAYYQVFTPPDPYTVFLHQTFPENHPHLHQFRDAVTAPLRTNHDQELHIPRTDVRETPTRFYFEVELPGVDDVAQLRLKWMNSRSLTLAARIERPKTKEDEEAGEGEHPELVHHLLKGRSIGRFERTFYFPVEVNAETMTARLHAGLVRIVIEKAHPEKGTSQAAVDVEHSGQ